MKLQDNLFKQHHKWDFSIPVSSNNSMFNNNSIINNNSKDQSEMMILRNYSKNEHYNIEVICKNL